MYCATTPSGHVSRVQNDGKSDFLAADTKFAKTRKQISLHCAVSSLPIQLWRMGNKIRKGSITLLLPGQFDLKGRYKWKVWPLVSKESRGCPAKKNWANRRIDARIWTLRGGMMVFKFHSRGDRERIAFQTSPDRAHCDLAVRSRENEVYLNFASVWAFFTNASNESLSKLCSVSLRASLAHRRRLEIPWISLCSKSWPGGDISSQLVAQWGDAVTNWSSEMTRPPLTVKNFRPFFQDFPLISTLFPSKIAQINRSIITHHTQNVPHLKTPRRSSRHDTMTDNIPDEQPSFIPPNLSSSIILDALPRDATTALTQASTPSKQKGIPTPFSKTYTSHGTI